MVNPSHSEIDELVQKYDLHEIIEDDLKEPNTQDKIDVYDEHIFLVLYFPKYHHDNKRHFSNEFNFILAKDLIFSFSKYPTQTIDNIRANYLSELKECEKEDDKKLMISPYYILYKILDELYDKTLLGLRKFNKDILDLEELIFENNSAHQNVLENLLTKSRNITFVKNLMNPQEEILEELNKATIKLFEWDLDVYFEDLQYKVDKVTNTIKSLAENTESISTKYNTLATLRTNSVVTVLTITTVIIGFMTLMTWFYGMNVKLPGQENPIMWIFTIGLMLLVGILLMWIFRRKKWM